MEMSLLYMHETTDQLKEMGFVVVPAQTELGHLEEGSCVSHTFTCTRKNEELVLETVVHPNEAERYFLQIRNFHGLSTFSFPLDSWKHRSGSIEFKYYSLPEDGRGLSFVLKERDVAT